MGSKLPNVCNELQVSWTGSFKCLPRSACVNLGELTLAQRLIRQA